MKNIFYIAVLMLALGSCGNEKKEPQDTKAQPDTIVTESEKPLETPVADTTEDLLEDIKNTTIETGIAELDRVIKDLENDQSTHTTITDDYCWGDCCGSTRTLIRGNEKVYLFKFNCYEYGFGNEQYYLVNDTLRLCRNFRESIAEFPTEKTPTVLLVHEEVTVFEQGRATVKTRERQQPRPIDYNLQNIPFKKTDGNNEKLMVEKTKALAERLELETFEEENP